MPVQPLRAQTRYLQLPMAVTPDVKRFFQASKCLFPPFSADFHPSVQNWSTFQLIYHFSVNVNFGIPRKNCQFNLKREIGGFPPLSEVRLGSLRKSITTHLCSKIPVENRFAYDFTATFVVRDQLSSYTKRKRLGKDGPCGMSELQQGAVSPVNDAAVPWWLRLCRWLWKLAGFLGTSVVLALTVNIASTWFTTPNGALPDNAPFSFLMKHWPITFSIGGCLFLLAALFWAISRWSVPASSLSVAITPQGRKHFLRRLRLRYEQMLAQSLQGVVQIELGLAERPAAIHNEALLMLNLPEQAEQVLPPRTSIVDAYNLAQQELLILGEPGAGKSTLLLELARYLVEQAEQDTEQPLPILLPLPSWANKRLELQEWLIEQLALFYAVPRKLSEQWVKMELVLPLLDGLDEMDKTAHPACIEAINMYHRDHLHPLVVCSRTQEYDTAATRERLALHTAVVVQPLSKEQVDMHLAALGKPLVALRRALKKNATLAELTTTPLMLQVLMLTYHGISVRELSHKEVQLRQQIWDDYVQRMVSRKGDTKRYPLHVTVTWLSELARQMRVHNQTIFNLEQLQSDWLPQRQIVFYRWSVGLLFGLVGGLLFGLIGGLLVGLVSGLLFGLIGELYEVGVSRRPWHEVREMIDWLVTWLFFGLAGLLSALVGSLAAGVVGWLLSGLVAGLFFVVIVGLFFAVVIFMAIGFGLREELKQGLVKDLESLMVRGLAFGLIMGLIVGLIVELPIGLVIGLVVGLAFKQASDMAFGLILTSVFGLSAGLSTGLIKLAERKKKGYLFMWREFMLWLSIILGTVLLGTGLFAGLLAELFTRLPPQRIAEPLAWLLAGSVLGLAVGPANELLTVTRHYALRFWLWRTHLFPWKAVSFLEDATARILLRRVGGGFSFTHRLLLEYFAELETIPPPSTSPGAHPVQQPPQP